VRPETIRLDRGRGNRMHQRSQMTEETVARLAEAAELHLTRDRLELLAPQLDGLVAAANELNRKMAEHRDAAPVVRFTLGASGEEER